jgi:hypothetical protein
MAEKKFHKGHCLAQDTIQAMRDKSEWYGDVDQTQTRNIAVVEMLHQRAGRSKDRKNGKRPDLPPEYVPVSMLVPPLDRETLQRKEMKTRV